MDTTLCIDVTVYFAWLFVAVENENQNPGFKAIDWF